MESIVKNEITIVKHISKKFNRKEELIKCMLDDLKREKYKLNEIKDIITNFYIEKLHTNY